MHPEKITIEGVQYDLTPTAQADLLPVEPDPVPPTESTALISGPNGIAPGPVSEQELVRGFYGDDVAPAGYWMNDADRLHEYLTVNAEGELWFTHNSNASHIPVDRKGAPVSASSWLHASLPHDPALSVYTSFDVFAVDNRDDPGRPLKSGKFGGVAAFSGEWPWPGASSSHPLNASLRFTYAGDGEGYETYTAYLVGQPLPDSYSKSKRTNRYPAGEWHVGKDKHGRGVTREWPIAHDFIWNRWFNVRLEATLNSGGKADGHARILLDGEEVWSVDDVKWTEEDIPGWNRLWLESMVGGRSKAARLVTPNKTMKVGYRNFEAGEI